MGYLLDTNIVSYILKKRNLTVNHKLEEVRRLGEEVFVSCIKPLFIDGIEYEIIENPPRPYSKTELDYSDDVVVECKIYSKYELLDYFFGYVYCDGGRFEDDSFIDEYPNFAKVVTDNLRNITVFRLGETQVHIYLVGQTKNGNWIIIHTISIET
ncbi:MAG: nuclease A inhibitor family protein [Cyanobacteria bacterium P01_A01_bin.84]